METALVSIIVPVYNTAEYVEECIQSVLSQSYKNIELILVNDGSTDGSGKICKKYEDLPNVLYIEKENAGVVEARKLGVEKARGEWIMFVDSDDLLTKDGVLLLVSLSTDVDIVIGMNNRNTSLMMAPNYYEWQDYLYGLYNTSIPGSPFAKLFRRELINSCSMAFEYKLARGEDVLMNLAIGKTNRKMVPICKNIIYLYRERFNSATHSFTYEFDYCYNLCKIADSFVEGVIPIDEVLKGSISRRMYYYKKVVAENDYHSDKNHPFVREITKRMNEAKILKLSDRIILMVSGRKAMIICLFLAKIIRRIENPSRILIDIKRIIMK